MTSGEGRSRVEFIDIGAPPEALLRRLGKDCRLVAYGGANFGMPLDLIESDANRAVPNDRFFVRSNGPVPVLDPNTWRLDVSGNTERRLTLSLDDLRRLGSSRIEAFLECAGNGRTRFDPVPPGTPWRNDAVGNAVWEGVPLGRVLDLAGIKAGTVDIVAQGADFPEMRRGLPLSVARDPEVLVVWGMNGEPLPVAHGGPMRLLVPGWAGIASTKWLVGIEVIDRAFDGFWNADNYVIWDERGDPLRPVAEMPPKSVIVTPAEGQSVSSGPTLVAGWAWSGFGPIQAVDVSTNAGQSWRCADLLPGERRGWRRWEMTWVATPGEHRLRARATDERRLSQPAVAPWNAKGYLMNAIQEIAVVVEP
ncbi:MAG: sulfite oxidase [Chloroflexi bacterium]|nr:sulfite oxidase [Chloroflexota bacterium]